MSIKRYDKPLKKVSSGDRDRSVDSVSLNNQSEEKCEKCGSLAHTEQEQCSSFRSGSKVIQRFRYMHEDPMYNIIQETKRKEKEERIKQLQALLDDTTSESESETGKKKNQKKKHKKSEQKNKTRKRSRERDISKHKKKKTKHKKRKKTSPEKEKKKEEIVWTEKSISQADVIDMNLSHLRSKCTTDDKQTDV